ncbi:MAG: DMT family transporter [Flavobacteriales bacterium]|nr:DMT family transporter [Flavobacteriales bacterium]
MALVLMAALCMALLFATFKVFARRSVPLLPAIVVNYFTAFVIGCAITLPWKAHLAVPLIAPAALLGALFIIFFYITAVATDRVGVAIATVSSKMSLVLTVLFAIVVFGDRPGITGWAGILLAFIAVLASAWPSDDATRGRGQWWLPLVLFLGTAVVDITLNTVQRTVLTRDTAALFPAFVFGVAGFLGLVVMVARRRAHEIRDHRALIGGLALGAINYASVHFIIGALDQRLPAQRGVPLDEHRG